MERIKLRMDGDYSKNGLVHITSNLNVDTEGFFESKTETFEIGSLIHKRIKGRFNMTGENINLRFFEYVPNPNSSPHALFNLSKNINPTSPLGNYLGEWYAYRDFPSNKDGDWKGLLKSIKTHPLKSSGSVWLSMKITI